MVNGSELDFAIAEATADFKKSMNRGKHQQHVKRNPGAKYCGCVFHGKKSSVFDMRSVKEHVWK